MTFRPILGGGLGAEGELEPISATLWVICSSNLRFRFMFGTFTALLLRMTGVNTPNEGILLQNLPLSRPTRQCKMMGLEMC